MCSLYTPIKAQELSLSELFKDHVFFIPKFQRPFAWTEDNFEDLFTDIYDAMKEDEKSVYFLGSMVLWNQKDEKQDQSNKYIVIDGQQRLTSLILLLAVARDRIKSSRKRNDIHKFIFQEEDTILGTPAIRRLEPWDELKDVFAEYVYIGNGTNKLLEKSTSTKISREDDPAFRVMTAVETFHRLFAEKMRNEDEVEKFVRYLLRHVYIVVIKTADFSSAIRLFNVLNTRGMPLSPIDIIKAINLEPINEAERERYAAKWIDLENEIGREELENLLSHMRLIYAKEKARGSLPEEFEELYRNNRLKKGIDFIKLIDEYRSIYISKFLEPRLQDVDRYQVNKFKVIIAIMRNPLPFSEWVAPLIYFYYKFRDDKSLLSFLQNLEKKTIIEWMANFSRSERLTSYIRILKLIESVEDSNDVIGNMLTYLPPDTQLRGKRVNFEDNTELEKIINDTLDRSDFGVLKGGRLAKYLLLKLEIEHWDLNTGVPPFENVTIEHILPRNPDLKSEWARIFDENARREWTEKFGNLVLLSGPRNSAASNYDFKKKLEEYFKKKWTPFSLTQKLKDYETWNLATLQERHTALKEKIKRIYI